MHAASLAAPGNQPAFDQALQRRLWRRCKAGDVPRTMTGVFLRDDHDHWHAFTQYEIQPRPGIPHYHFLTELLETIDIPVVPDVAEARPAHYNVYLSRLTALETG